MRRLRPVIAAALLFGAFGCSDDVDEQIAELRDATSKYADIGMALDEGYMSTYEYATSPEGGMGIHFLNPTITGIDRLRPNVLLYDLDEHGMYSLIAVEWFVPSAGLSEAPTLFGQTFDGPMPGHEAGQPEHYELHVWLYRDNPEGMYTGFNPDVTPPSYVEDIQTARSAVMMDYSDYKDAIDAGYANTMACASSPDGGMGVHFVNEAMRGPAEPDAPNVLLYAPMGDSYELVGAEWFVPSSMVSEAPMLFGQTFEGPMPGHEAGQPEHYDLHVWLVRTNPLGLFTDFNPTVACP